MTGGVAERVDARLARMAADDLVARVWRRDPAVWSGDPATPELGNRLGWLDLPDTMAETVADLITMVHGLAATFERVVLCGMGGSSLAPEVLWRTFGPKAGYPALHLLDSTHPDAVRAAAPDELLDRTLFLIASKSGTTIETSSFEAYFWERTGGDASRFIAVTDPDTALDRRAQERGYRAVVRAPADVGGRFSALTPFGLLPAALIGVDPAVLLDGARSMMEACRAPAPDNPGARLGALMAEGVGAGRDKLTLLLDERLASLGLWVEQLVAESTGKAGTGVLPVVGEAPDELSGAEPDRIVAVRGIGESADGALHRAAARLAGAGLPVDAAWLDAPDRLGAEFFRWEFATAIAGALLGVNPFDQPNVAESKAATARVLDEGSEPAAAADPGDVRRWLQGLAPGHYAAVLAYLPPSPGHDARLAALRRALARRTGVAVTLGYGPRYLHSTGQLHKGGPPRGHFLQLVPEVTHDVPVPGSGYGFRTLLLAQAEGDRAALEGRGRPVVRVTDWDGLDAELDT